MYCSKCGAQIPEGGSFCPSCGAPVSGPAAKGAGPKALDMLSKRAQADPAAVIIVLGALLVIIGAFLHWVGGMYGIEGAEGAVVCAVAVLSLAVLVLARSGATGKWGVVMLLLSALALALIFESLATMEDRGYIIAAGFWIAMSGTLIITFGSLLEQWGSPKE